MSQENKPKTGAEIRQASINALINASHETIFWLDENLVCTKCQNCENLIIPVQEFIGKEITYLLPPVLLPRIESFCIDYDTDAKFEFEFQYPLNNILHDFEATLVHVTKGSYLLSVRDATEIKRYEYELKNSEKKFRILLETASQAILLVNMHGQVTMANTSAEKLFGYEFEELIDQPVEILIPIMLHQKHIRHRTEYIADPSTRPMGKGMDLMALRKNGSEFPVEIGLSSVDIYEGVFVMAFITDISERKKLDVRLRQVEKLEAIGQLAGGIAHDFNNVLAGIMGLTELALRKIDEDHPARENLTLVVKKADNASNLVRQLLAFSRKQLIKTMVTNLNYNIENNMHLLQRYLGEDIKLRTDLDQKLNTIKSDHSALDQIITNLCINARDAMPDGGDLVLKTENILLTDESASSFGDLKSGSYVKLSVSDSGIGMRQEVAKHIFEPFFTTKDIGEGTGLGLSSVYGLVNQHNGHIYCESELGEGTTFHVFFPAFSKEYKEQSNTEKPEDIRGGNETILLVEDESDLIHVFSTSLEEKGYNVIVAANGVNALSILEQRISEIDLIISDVVMPKMGGIELKLFAERLNPEIRVLLMSAHSDKLSEGHSYLPKPFQTNDLLLKVRQMLDLPAHND